eukprot:327310-Pleurochrysis_carterae.AAC.11
MSTRIPGFLVRDIIRPFLGRASGVAHACSRWRKCALSLGHCPEGYKRTGLQVHMLIPYF